ncbi:MAG: protein adenylyltransferase SelO [Peptostreptococcaceae bacterium]
MDTMDTKMGFNFDNSYLTLPGKFYSKVTLSSVKKPELVIFNYELAKELNLNSKELTSKEGLDILSGSVEIEQGAYIAQAYAGHQFGNFTMLGDGRALLIGEQITKENKRYDIQLKGSGKTIYSRRGDGRAVLGPMLREYIISEAMYNLKIPTTRSLAVVKTNKAVIREHVKQGAILTRVSSSHLRFGTFEYASNFGKLEDVKALADYAINRHYPFIKDDENKYLNFLKEVIKVHASLVAKWMSVGFIHGVMNTDNMTISGETIDYGPCAFMDNYKSKTVFSSIDRDGRYSYENQPFLSQWNLCRFAETLIPLINENIDIAIKVAQEAISEFMIIYHDNWISIMRSKLGIFNEEEQDKALIEDLLSMMEKYSSDFTNTFIDLTLCKYKEDNKNYMYKSEEFTYWIRSWENRLKRQSNSKNEQINLMKSSNPSVIPRNHRVEEALKHADNGDYEIMKKLLDVLKNPYSYLKSQEEYYEVPKSVSCSLYRTYCGT